MQNIHRRKFIIQTTKAAGAAIALSQLPSQIFAAAKAGNMPLGFQSWTVKDKLGANFAGTLKTMADMGYNMIEMCSPKGYAQIGFGAFSKMKASEIKKIINDAGLTCPSCHYGFSELTDDVDDRIEFAKELGLTQMICSTFWLPKTATLNDYLAAADKLNKNKKKIIKRIKQIL